MYCISKPPLDQPTDVFQAVSGNLLQMCRTLALNARPLSRVKMLQGGDKRLSFILGGGRACRGVFFFGFVFALVMC